jgi:hypothetical protein
MIGEVFAQYCGPMKKSCLLLITLCMPMLLRADAVSVNPESCVKDVIASFSKIQNKVVPLSTWTQDVFEKGSYVQRLKTRMGLDNHLQGIVRIPGTSSFVLTGGDKYQKEASLFVAEFDSENQYGLLTQNFREKKASDTPIKDRYLTKLNIGSDNFWHAGGIGILDRLLVVPIENHSDGSSKIIFFDLSEPHSPKKLDIEIERDHSTTGSVLIYRNEFDKIIVGGSVDGNMEFYESRTNNIRDGFLPSSVLVETTANGQGTDIVQQCDGKLFIIDFRNTSKFAPIIWGKDYVRLYSLDFNKQETKLLSRRFFNTQKNCNFNAAGSHFVTESGKLTLYGSSFYRHSGGTRFKMCQFSE